MQLRPRLPCSVLAALLGIVSIIAVAPGVRAAIDGRPAGRFDGHLRARVGGQISVSPVAVDELHAADALRTGWEAFRGRHGGAWKIYLDERSAMPMLVSGRGIQLFDEAALDGMTLDSLEAGLRSFLRRYRTLLGDWSSSLALDREASAELRNGYWKAVFSQRLDGVRVEDARFEFHIQHGRLTMFGASLWAAPGTSGVPELDQNVSRQLLDEYLGVATALYPDVEEPELTIVALDADPALQDERGWSGPRGAGLDHALVWRFRFRIPGEPAIWVGEVDAHDGSILAFYDDTRYTAIRGGVFPISNDEDCASGGCEIQGFPMPFADYTEDGQVEEFSDAYGNLMCGDPGAGFQSHLAGPYFRVQDVCGATDETGSCDTGVDFGLKRGENCDVGPGASPGNTAAARSAYYHLNRTAELARFYDPENSWLQSPVTVIVNIDATCNAYWNGNINMYGAGSGCGNTGEQQGVTVHEWGHGYDQNDGGGYDFPSEAYADIVAIFAARDSCVSRGFYNDGSTCSGFGDACLSCTGLRDLDWAARQRNTPATGSNFAMVYCPAEAGAAPCGREPHCEGYVAGEAIFDLATRDLPASGLDPDTAWQLAERLWYGSRPGSGGNAYACIRGNTNSCAATSWYQKMRAADDDDGDLSNGTPHGAALFAAFNRHKLACGQAGDPENQSSSSCPALARPVLTVTEIVSGTELSWSAVSGADEYRVYRGELGCDRQQIPIAALPGTQTAFVDPEADPGLPRFYRVEAFGVNRACQSEVSNCESTPAGARLQMTGHRLIEDGSADNGIPDPGETVRMPVTLLNGGLDAATAVQGTLRIADPTQGTVSDPDATWADLASSQIGESVDPHFEFTVDPSVSCGEILTFEMDLLAADAETRTQTFQVPLGEPQRDFLNDVDVSVPPETTAPVTSTIFIDQDHPIAELDVSVFVQHAMESELIVSLESPAGTSVRLHDRTDLGGNGLHFRYDQGRAPDGPGTMGDFIGESTLGTWTLSVEDVGPLSPGDGTIRDWTLHVRVGSGFDCHPAGCDPVPAEPVAGLLVGKSANGADLDLVLSWDALAAAGYRVWQSETPTFDEPVETGRTDGETTLSLPNGAHTTPLLTYFQVRGLNSCDQEGP